MRLVVAALAVCALVSGCALTDTHTYRVPSAAMEPTIHCAKPAVGCRGTADDRIVVRPGKKFSRGDIVVFNTPSKASVECGEGGIFVKRVIGLPGEAVKEDEHGFIWVRHAGSGTWKKLAEPYISASDHQMDVESRPEYRGEVWHVPPGDYFVLGDNRAESCDSRAWGGVPKHEVIGPVVKIIHAH